MQYSYHKIWMQKRAYFSFNCGFLFLMSMSLSTPLLIFWKKIAWPLKGHTTLYRLKCSQNFGKFISQEQHIRILIWSIYCLNFNLLFKWPLGLWSKYDFDEDRNYEFSRNLRKIYWTIIVINALKKISDDDRFLQKA